MFRVTAYFIACWGLGLGGSIFLLFTPGWISDGRIMSKGELVVAKLLPKERWILGRGKRGGSTKYYVLETTAEEGAVAQPHEIWITFGHCNIEPLFAKPAQVMMDRRSDQRHWGVVPKCYEAQSSYMNWLLGFVLLGLISGIVGASWPDPYREWMADPRNQPNPLD
jgi:hypothetical protein